LQKPTALDSEALTVMHLWLLRHAKSSWDEPGLDDRDRTLSRRGERDAERIGGYLAAEGVFPALVLCSPAVRARQTLARVLAAMDVEPEVVFEPSLYAFTTAALLDVVRAAPDAVSPLLLVGHNPATQELARSLAARGEGLDQLARKYPTGALAEIALAAGSWRDVAEGSGELMRFVRPRDLDG
jgi:phosphohistidine phosphatase